MTRYVVQSAWSDVPHLDAAAKTQLESAYPPHEQAARTKGIPQLGSGAIYPVAETEIMVQPFQIPTHYKHVYGMDVGWNRTAALWAAIDPDTEMAYFYAEYYRAHAEPPIHAEGIKAIGAWIPGVIDPTSRGRSQIDGQSLLTIYRTLGLRLSIANNTVESGIYEMWTRLSTGKLKAFSHLQNFLAEYRMYRRDEKGKIVKENDHLLDAGRYICMSGLGLAAFRPVEDWTSGRPKGQYQAAHDPFADAWNVVEPSPKGKQGYLPHRGY